MSESKLEDVKKWAFICARCNSCKFIYRQYEDSCPAGSYYWFEPYWASGRNLIARGLIEGSIEWSASVAEKIFACIMCGSCEQQCEQDVGDHLIEIFEALRQEAIAKGFGPMPEHVAFKKSIDQKHNPYGEKHEDRFSEEYLQKHIKDKGDVIYFVGCTSAYREKEVVRYTVSLLEKMGINFAILRDEFCCGSPLLTTGQIDAAKEVALENVERIKNTGANTVITSCAGCFRTLAIQYKEKFGLDLPFRVLHFSEFLNENLNRLKFKSKEKTKIIVTYHDPCHLGRHGGVYNAPRQVLKKLPNVELVEMNRVRENAWCCGAGAGVKSAFKDFALETAKRRVEESETTGADTLITCCPFCERNLGDAINALESDIILKDLVELVDELTI